MKTFKGNDYFPIDEGILSSTNTGKASICKEFINKYFKYHKFTYVNPTTINAENYDMDFTRIGDTIKIPFTIEECKNLIYCKNLNKIITLPKKAIDVTIKSCKNLEKIKVNEISKLKSLTIENCENLNIYEDDLKGLECDELIIKKCNISSLKPFNNITTNIIVINCKNLKTFDLEPNNTSIDITIDSCPIDNFNNIKCNKLELLSLENKSKKIDLQINNCQKLFIEDDDKTAEININGTVQIAVINNCKQLQKLSMCDCKKTLSLVDLPELEEYNFPQRFSGSVILDNVKITPIINCKKIIKR